MPSTWEAYGVDANEDGRKDPYNPVDAICAAARYLRAAGGQEDLRTRDLRLQPRRLVRRRGPALREPVRPAPRRPGRLADRAHRGRPLPGRRQRPLRRRHLRAPGAGALEARQGRRRQRRRGDLELTHTSRDQHLLPRGRAGGRRQRRRDHRDRQVEEARQVHRPAATPTATASPTPSSARSPTSTRCRSRTQAHRRRLQARHPRRRRDARRAPRARRRRPTSCRRGGAEASAHGRETADEAAARSTPRTPRAPLRLPRARENADRADLTGQLDELLADKFPGYESLQGLLLRRPALRPQDDGARPLKEGSKVIAGTVLGRIGKTDELAPTSTSRSARPAAARRRSTRSRSSTAGSCSRRRRSTAPPARTRSTGARLDRPGAVDVEGAAGQARAHRPAARDLRLRPRGHPDRPDRPPRAGAARVPGRARLPAHGHLAQVRPLVLHRPRATSPTTPPATRSTSPRSTAMPVLGNQGPGSITEALVSDMLQLQGTMDPNQIISLMDYSAPTTRSRWATTPTTCTSATRRSYGPGSGIVSQAVQRDPQARPVGAPDRPHRRDRQPRRCRPSPPKYALPDEERPRREVAERQARAAPRAPTSASSRHVAPSPSASPSSSSSSPGRSGSTTAATCARDPERVLVVRVADAPPPPRRRLRRRKPQGRRPERRAPDRPADDADRDPRPSRSASEAAAEAGWPSCAATPTRSRPSSPAPLALVNRALHAHRAATLDPALADVARRARAARCGSATAPARSSPTGAATRRSRCRGPRAAGRGEVLRPQERVAAVLGGREPVAACERCPAARPRRPRRRPLREAALQLRVGLEALLADARGVRRQRPGGRPGRAQASAGAVTSARQRGARGDAQRAAHRRGRGDARAASACCAASARYG